MIPRLLRERADNGQSTFARSLLASGFEGDIALGDADRVVLSTDNSIYQVEPRAVLYPRTADDLRIVARVLSDPAHASVRIAPRGGGTGANGQSLSDGYVVDCSRYMNRILEIDPERRMVRVEAGVVKDQLNKALRPYGLFFAPELSTSNRATIGGMISTDACGQGSCLYGKTSNHVLSLHAVLVGGEEWCFRPAGGAELQRLLDRKDRIGEIYRTVDRICREKRADIDRIFPDLNRYMTGYDLAHARNADGGIDVGALLCGSEGTLAIISQAELNVLPIPAFAALVNVRYDNFNTALEVAYRLTALRPASIETIDETVLRLARSDNVWPSISRYFPEDGNRQATGINIIEVLAETERDLEEKVSAVTASFESDRTADRVGYTITRGPQEVEAVWSMRKRAVGLLGAVQGAVRPVAFVEDTAVPPQNLASYIREFRALLDEKGLAYGMFGHVDAGVLHVRPALDLTLEDHAPMVREITDKVVELTRRYGGVLWGEHGKGYRSEYVPAFFGDLYPSLREIKRAFDPNDQLNPGKIASAGNQPLSRIDEIGLRGGMDRTIDPAVRADFDNALYCNGNGACFDFDTVNVMCPSYKATLDRVQSPKGRASLLREWLRLASVNHVDPRKMAIAIRHGPWWMGFLRLWNSLHPRNRDDFSHDVRRAMDTCLACKGCTGQCPVKVNVPAFRSKFLELYYSRYARPLKDPIVAAIERLMPLMSRARPAYNLVATTALGQRLTCLVGLTALPAIPPTRLGAELERHGVPVVGPKAMSGLPPEDLARTVVLVQDTFTSHYEPELVVAMARLIAKLGFRPMVCELFENGKPNHVLGYLGRFERIARRSNAILVAIADRGVDLVGVDPSMTLAFRGEYRQTLKGRSVPDVLLPQEWLLRHLDALPPASGRQSSYQLLLHCTERANLPSAPADWRKVFERAGLAIETAEAGCCGMAGTFGHEVRNRTLSDKIYELSWKDVVEGPNTDVELVATGYSCRSQVNHLSRRRLRHPVEALERAIGVRSPPPTTRPV